MVVYDDRTDRQGRCERGALRAAAGRHLHARLLRVARLPGGGLGQGAAPTPWLLSSGWRVENYTIDNKSHVYLS